MPTIDLNIEFDPNHDDEAWIFIDGYVNEKDYRFLLDTGAGRSSIIADEFTAQFKAEGESDGRGVFMAKADDLVAIPKLQVGPVAVENLVISRISDSVENRNNLLAMDFWQHVSCAYYFEKRQLIVNPTQNEVSSENLYKLQVGEKYHPYIPIKFNDISANTVWDTGASITVVDSNFVDKYPQLFTPDGFDDGTDSSGETFQTPMYQMHACQITERTFSAIRVAAVDLGPINATIEIPMDMILGYNILRQANWLFDFPNKQWAFID